jgi:hypothetical protein
VDKAALAVQAAASDNAAAARKDFRKEKEGPAARATSGIPAVAEDGKAGPAWDWSG